ncbi:MAG TPA: DUF4214 domain-containing protein [Pyrinomonadaceae bacterium]
MSAFPRAPEIFLPNRRHLLTPAALAACALFVCLITSAVTARAQESFAPNIVISQIYTRGGEQGAAFQSDYIELFNRGNTSIDINGFALQLTTSNNTVTAITFSSSQGIMVGPGKYVLLEMARGTSGQPLPAPDFPSIGSFTPNLSPTAGYVALYRRSPTVFFGGCPSGDDLLDMVGYGAGAACFEGGAPAPAPSEPTTALVRDRGGCDDFNTNALDLRVGAANPRNRQTSAALCTITPGPSTIEFAATQFDAAESDGRAAITVTRVGETVAPATVEFIVADGAANDRQDYTTAWGTLRFEPGETSKTFRILLTDDAAQEDNETVQMALANPTGLATLGTRALASLVIQDNDFGSAAPNPDDDPTFFARQHYHDFLNREPDASGLAFWSNQINECGTNAACREVRRINTSAAFFLSIEFQETGFLVHRIYRAAFSESAARPRGLPRYREFVRDSQTISRGVVVGEGDDWRLRLDTNQREFVKEFVERAEFKALYPATMSAAEYVDALNRNAGGFITSPLREQMIFNLQSGAFDRAEVLRIFAENRAFTAAQKNPAFVLMQYFGYLRRNPDDAPEAGLNFDGYDFWLAKLNQFGGDFQRAEMVKAFITSAEYRQRFAAAAP